MPRAVRERQMLDAAVRVFGERGYRAASMDDIAELAGVSKPLVYLYLNSKEELFSACIQRESAALIAAVRAGVSGGEGADRQLWDGLRAGPSSRTRRRTPTAGPSCTVMRRRAVSRSPSRSRPCGRRSSRS
jgi:AcrR family transcriptional regulator